MDSTTRWTPPHAVLLVELSRFSSGGEAADCGAVLARYEALDFTISMLEHSGNPRTVSRDEVLAFVDDRAAETTSRWSSNAARRRHSRSSRARRGWTGSRSRRRRTGCWSPSLPAARCISSIRRQRWHWICARGSGRSPRSSGSSRLCMNLTSRQRLRWSNASIVCAARNRRLKVGWLLGAVISHSRHAAAVASCARRRSGVPCRRGRTARPLRGHHRDRRRAIARTDVGGDRLGERGGASRVAAPRAGASRRGRCLARPSAGRGVAVGTGGSCTAISSKRTSAGTRRGSRAAPRNRWS